MPIQQTIKGELACKYLEQYPSHPTKSIAAILFEKEPDVFDSVEQARNVVRFYRGRKDGGNCLPKDKRFIRENGNQSDRPPFWHLPEPIQEGAKWEVVKIGFERALLLFDLHIPFHNLTALQVALKYGIGFKPDCIILGGDVGDFYSASYFDRDPSVTRLSIEIEYCRCFLEDLRRMFPNARIIWKEGNHDERLWRRVVQKIPDIIDIKTPEGKPMFSLEGVMDFKEYGIELVDNKKPILCGEHLHVVHGHEFQSPLEKTVNPARGLFRLANCNAICGHLHVTSEHTDVGLQKTTSCWSAGCLCELHPRYRPINKWNHGFATVEIDKQGRWSVENKKIISGKVV